MHFSNQKAQQQKKPPPSDKKTEISQPAESPPIWPEEGAQADQSPTPPALSDAAALPKEEEAPKQGEATSETITPEADLTSKILTKTIIELPPETTMAELNNITLPFLPYTIHANIHNTFQETNLTQREIFSHNLPVYVVPVNIKGNIAQALFSVTQDGRWYRVNIGNFSTKKSTRETLSKIVERLPNYHLEIIKYDYAIECGRFLVKEEADALSEKLVENGFYPYSQLYLTQDERVIRRIMVGCYFSKKGAQEHKNQLEEKGYSVKIAKR